MRDLTDTEHAVIDLLADAWELYGELDEVHPSDVGEFGIAIHAAQNIIMARPATEEFQKE